MGKQPKFSFVVANYNYERFVGNAIASALAVDWPDVEVIVVDDGSTDNSRRVIEGFGKRITAIFTPNGGQREATNLGFTHVTGDIVTFLDADDLVEPQFAREVAAVWNERVSKVQVLMTLVDGDNRPLGSEVPHIRTCPSSAQIREWATSTSEYPTPPGSGNAYSRKFLERFFPLGPEHDAAPDSTCLALAPLMGEVVTIMKPLAKYRRHGENDSNIMRSPETFGKEVGRAMTRQNSIESVCGRLGIEPPPSDTLRRSLHLLQLRVASLRLGRVSHPMQQDDAMRIAKDAVSAIFRDNYLPFAKRAALGAWVLAVLVSPLGLAKPLIDYRFSASN